MYRQTGLPDIEDALRRGDGPAAVAAAERFLQRSPAHIEARRLWCAGLRLCGQGARALAELRTLADAAPRDALVQNSFGAALRESGDFEAAQRAFERASELAPELAPVWYNLAIMRLMRDDDSGAHAALARAFALAPENAAIRLLRTDMLRDQGRIDIVSAEYRRMIARDPLSPWGWFGLANLKNVSFTESERMQMHAAVGRHPPGRARAALQFALAKACEDQAQYAAAWSAIDAANAQMRACIPWDATAFRSETRAILAAFAGAIAAADPMQGAEAIFVVGLPRSGSTLVEQILASHPQVAAAGERDDLENVIAAESRRRALAFPAWVRSATSGDWTRLGRQYLASTARWRSTRPRHADKMPANWRLAGAALAMLPQARIVVCRRDPLETTFSCYRQLFAGEGHGYSYDPADLAAYWHDFDQTCRAWQQRYPQRVFDFVHEDLLQDQESATRALLAFCGLDYDAACLRFHETARSITTISAAQVREPLRRDTARAPGYGTLLDPLRKALDASPSAPAR